MSFRSFTLLPLPWAGGCVVLGCLRGKTTAVFLFGFSEPRVKLSSFMGGLSTHWWGHNPFSASTVYQFSTAYCPPIQSKVGG